MKPSLVEWYRREILPRLTAEVVFAGVRFSSRSAREWRGPCPLHGGNNPTAFKVDPKTLTWTCFTGCQRSGDALAFLNGGESPRGARFAEVVHQAAEMAQTPPQPFLEVPKVNTPSPTAGKLQEHWRRFQDYLPRSWGERYLQMRGIPLDLALRCGLGYAPPGQWPHLSRDWRWGRLVIPHTDPDGQVISLYGRAVGRDDQVPRTIRHDHLPGGKGYFHARALRQGSGPVFVCEGPFDALSLLAAGYSRALATFGARSWRWDWARSSDHLVFALDQDQAGQQAQQALARGALMRGKKVSAVCWESLGASKDVNEWWCQQC